MSDFCGCPPEAGNTVCELPAPNLTRTPHATHACPICGQKGKPVQGQTVKALLSVSLRQVQDVAYLFCRAPQCPVVYFSTGGEQHFAVGHIRERVYQKETEAADVLVCYCFEYTAGHIRAASSDERSAPLEDINAGINAGQCACDLRNPQGSCCLGNVRSLIRQMETAGLHS